MPAEPRVREAIDLFIARVRHDLDAHLHGLTSDLLRLVREREESWRSETDRLVGDARAEAQRESRGITSSGRSERATLERLLAVVRQLDDASTLTGILGVLAAGAAAETSRVAILLVDGDTLRPWGQFGFRAHVAPVSMPLAHVGFVAAAVALRQTSFAPSSLEGHDSTAPDFMRVPAGHTGLVAPIVVGSEVVAVLYADDVDRVPEREEAPAWAEEVELLVRHASLRLESVTSAQTVELSTGPA